MTSEEKLDVFKAFLDGKLIEFRPNDQPHLMWEPSTRPVWWFEKYDYRVKPEDPAASPEPDWKMRCIEWNNENRCLTDKNNQLAEKNRQLQSAYDDMRGQRDVLQDRISKTAFLQYSKTFDLLIEQRDKAEEEVDTLRGKYNVLVAENGVLKRAIQQFHNITKFSLTN